MLFTLNACPWQQYSWSPDMQYIFVCQTNLWFEICLQKATWHNEKKPSLGSLSLIFTSSSYLFNIFGITLEQLFHYMGAMINTITLFQLWLPTSNTKCIFRTKNWRGKRAVSHSKFRNHFEPKVIIRLFWWTLLGFFWQLELRH